MKYSGFSQVFEDEGYLTRGEHTLTGSVVRFFQRFGKFVVGPYPHSQAVQCRPGTDVGAIGFGQFAFEIRSDFHGLIYDL